MTFSLKKKFQNEVVTEVSVRSTVVCSEVVAKTKSGKVIRFLLADAPEWIRTLVLKEVL